MATNRVSERSRDAGRGADPLRRVNGHWLLPSGAVISLFASEDELRQSEPVLKQMNPPEGVGNRTAIDVYEVAAGWTSRARPNAGRGICDWRLQPQTALRPAPGRCRYARDMDVRCTPGSVPQGTTSKSAWSTATVPAALPLRGRTDRTGTPGAFAMDEFRQRGRANASRTAYRDVRRTKRRLTRRRSAELRAERHERTSPLATMVIPRTCRRPCRPPT
jgi:hypothetical protein